LAGAGPPEKGGHVRPAYPHELIATRAEREQEYEEL
jgi:hypothetical protein